jgi:hypothetical protein
LTCRLSSTSGYYKAGTKTQIKQKVQVRKNKTRNRQNKNNIAEENSIKEVLGQDPYTLTKT